MKILKYYTDFLAQGGALFSREGREELNVLLGHLRARTGVAETRA